MSVFYFDISPDLYLHIRHILLFFFGLQKIYPFHLLQFKVKTHVVIGDPKEKICEAVQDLHADLLVMGSRAFGPIKRYKIISAKILT